MFTFRKKESAGNSGDVWLLVGLGNPGPKYAKNRHNIGFMAVDEIAADHGAQAFKSKFQGMIADIQLSGQKALALKPMTFMNNSGQSVAAAAKFYKIPPEKIVVFHDELDIAPGKVKVKKGGGAAGHNGIKSIDSHLGTQDYWRVRLGIGHPGDRAAVHNYVLGDFAKADADWLEALINTLSDRAILIVEQGAEQYGREV